MSSYLDYKRETQTQPILPQPKQNVGLRALSWVGDILQRGNYASANVAKQKVEELKPKTTTERLKSIAKNYIPIYGPLSLATNKNYLRAAYRGITGKDKTTYSDVLDTAGVKNKYVKGIGGFALDVALDPTTYVTLGAGPLTKISTEAGIRTLNKPGVRYLGDLSSKIGRNKAEQQIAKELTKSPQLANKILDRGGIKFAGTTLPGSEKIVQPISDAVRGITGRFGRDAIVRNNLPYIRTQQAYRDITDASIKRYSRLYEKVFSGLSKSDKELITKSIYNGQVNSLPPKLREKANFAIKEFADMISQETGARFDIKKLNNYVTQLYKNPDKARKIFPDYEATSPILRYAKERKIKAKTFEEFQQKSRQLGLDPETDIEKILSTRRSGSVAGVEKTRFLDKVAKDFGVKKARDASVDMVKSSIKGLEDVYIPRDIYEHITKMEKSAVKSQEIRGVLKAYDKLLNTMKASLTTYFPAFHARNAASNVMQNYLDVGLLQAINPKFHSQTIKMMASKNLDDVVEFGGKKYVVKDLKRMMEDLGIFQGMGKMDVGGQIGKRQFGKKTASIIENEARSVNFLANLERSGDPVAAAERTKKFLFDYSNLTDTEQNIMKRIFPFWTWTSKNLALQAEQLIKQPGKYATMSKIKREADKTLSETDKKIIPEWMQDKLNIKIGDNKYLSDFGTPQEEVAETVMSPLSKGISMLSPLLKMPLEVGMNYDSFTKKPITENVNAKNISFIMQYAPESVKKAIGYDERTKVINDKIIKKATANPWVLYALRQPPFSRFGSSLGQLTDDKTSFGGRVLRATTGIAERNIDPDTQAYFKGEDYKKQIAQDFKNKGIISEYKGNYYVSKTTPMTDKEREEASYLVSLLNQDSPKLYKQASGIQSQVGVGDKYKKLNEKEQKISLLINSLQFVPEENKKEVLDAIKYLAMGYSKTPSWAKKKSGYSKAKTIKTVSVPTVNKRLPSTSVDIFVSGPAPSVT